MESGDCSLCVMDTGHNGHNQPARSISAGEPGGPGAPAYPALSAEARRTLVEQWSAIVRAAHSGLGTDELGELTATLARQIDAAEVLHGIRLAVHDEPMFVRPATAD